MMTSTILWTVSEILEAVGGFLVTGDRSLRFEGVSIDSRNVSPDNLFVAIQGERFDGHDFIGEVVEKGVKGVILSDKNTGGMASAAFDGRSPVLISVPDTIEALGDLAAFNRRRAKVSVAGVTGSNGKTTTRKMTAAVLRRRFSTLSTKGNFNNEIGLPLTLLRLSPKDRWAVLELGANHPGEIGRLAGICQPDIGIITNVGPAHLEGFGSLDGVAAAKGEMLDCLSPAGVAVLNADDERVAAMAQRAPGDVLFFGAAKKAQIRAADIENLPSGVRFTLHTPGRKTSVEIRVPGRFMVFNALAAAAAGYLTGLDMDEIKRALEVDFQPAHGRMNIVKSPAGVNIIDDAYNANPESMKAAFQAARVLKKENRCVFVIGDMLELGEQSSDLHRQLGRMAAGAKPARLYVAGENAENVAQGAAAGGMAPGDIFVGGKEEILEDLRKWLRPADWVLVKGSRGMRMEQIVEGLQKKAEE